MPTMALKGLSAFGWQTYRGNVKNTLCGPLGASAAIFSYPELVKIAKAQGWGLKSAPWWPSPAYVNIHKGLLNFSCPLCLPYKAYRGACVCWGKTSLPAGHKPLVARLGAIYGYPAAFFLVSVQKLKQQVALFVAVPTCGGRYSEFSSHHFRKGGPSPVSRESGGCSVQSWAKRSTFLNRYFPLSLTLTFANNPSFPK